FGPRDMAVCGYFLQAFPQCYPQKLWMARPWLPGTRPVRSGKSLPAGKKEYSARLPSSPNDSMKFLTVHPSAPHTLLSLRLAGWLLDNPRLGQAALAQRLAGQLLKQPARRGVVEAQSRLGLLLCRH